MWAAIACIVFFMIAVFLTNNTLYKPNRPPKTKVRIIFWVFWALTIIAGFVINLCIAQGIKIPSVYSNFQTHMFISMGIMAVTYILAGFLVSKTFPTTKVGLWF